MGGVLNQMFDQVSRRAEDEDDDDELGETSSLSGDDSDVVDDEESNISSSNRTTTAAAAASHLDSSHIVSPLHELSSLVSHRPIKRGLSKFYIGKSRSFSSFSDVRCVEDLARKETSPVIIKRKLRPSRSYAEGLDEESDQSSNSKQCFGSSSSSSSFDNKALISKNNNATRGSSCGSSISRTSRGIQSSYFESTGKPPPIPMHKNL